MRRIVLLFLVSPVLLAFLLGCAPKIHPSFEANHFVSGFSTYAVNTDKNIFFRSPGDVRYTMDRHKLDSIVRDVPVNQVLFYGRTDLRPFYELYVLLNPRMSRVNLDAFDRVHDTRLGWKRLVFLGRNLEDPFPESDFEGISGSLGKGVARLERLVPLSEIVGSYDQSPNFLKAYTAIADYPVAHPDDQGLKLQMELTYLSMMGAHSWYRERIADWEAQYATDASVLRTIGEKGLSGRRAVLDFLSEQTAGEQLVVFSENHFYPWHRILLQELLPDLRSRGYEYLALEALDADSLLNRGVLPDLSSGFYTREQRYYQLLLDARELGFTFVSYDHFQPGEDREAAQAENLYDKTFGQDPDARVVVLAGLDHIYERGGKEGDGMVRMAQHMKTRYGIDPLTISQSDLAHYRNELDSALAVIGSAHLDSERLRRVDIQVINNLEWGYAPGDFSYIHNGEGPVQLALYERSEWLSDFGYNGDIPEFSALLLPGEHFSAQLPEGTYQLLLFDAGGSVLRNETVSGTEED